MSRRALSAAAVLGLASGAAAVIGVDLGSDFIKVAGVQPGKGVDIVLNEQSKRKSNNYIGYRGEDRFLGEDASNLAPRFPKQMYTFLNRVIGKSWKDESARKLLSDDWALPFAFAENEQRNTIDLKNPDPDVTYSMEELLAQLFGYVKAQSENHMEMPVTELVVTIPSFFDFRQRQALVDAANMTGMKVHGLMHHTTAAAMQYGVQRRGFGNNTVNLIICDMGASRLEIGVYQFHPWDPTQAGDSKVKAKDVLGAMDVKAIASDETLGGRVFDVRLARYLGRKFEEKTKTPGFLAAVDAGDKTALKAFTSLLRRANRAKEMLSANKKSPVQIEELYEGKPFMYELTREELDEECKDLFARAVPTLQRALATAQLAVEDITAFEIIGGGIRIPRMQTELSEALNGRSLDRTLNGDECIALGAAFHAAKLSGSFRTKGFVITEIMATNVSFQLSQQPDSDKVPKIRPLFVNPRFGGKKSITVTRTSDFDVKLYTSVGTGEEEQHTLQMTHHIEGVAKNLDEVGFNKVDKSENSSHSVQVQIKLTDEGLLRLTSAEVKFDDHVVVQRRIKIKEPKPNATVNATDDNATVDGEKKEESAKEEEKKEEKQEEKKEDAEKKDGEEGEKGDGEKKEDGAKEEKKPEKKKPEYKTVNKTEVRKHRKMIVPRTEYVSPMPMTDADYKASGEVLKKLQSIEDKKKEAAAAKNELETYLYWVKYEGILDNEAMKEFMSEEDETALKDVLAKVDEWMEEGDGSSDNTGADAFKEQKKAVEKGVAPITDKKKAKEDAERKAKEEEARKKREAEEAIKKAAEDAKKAEEDAKKAAEEEAKGSGEEKKEDEKGEEKKEEAGEQEEKGEEKSEEAKPEKEEL